MKRAKSGGRAHPNGILPKRKGPTLSCFDIPRSINTAASWIRYIDEQAAARPAESSSSGRIAELMALFRTTCVFDPIDVASDVPPDLLSAHREQEKVLIIDEPVACRLDLSAHQRRAQFLRMCDAARTAHPEAEIWLARSGASSSGKRLSSLLPEQHAPFRQIGEHESLCASIACFAHVYTVSAMEGMQALLCGVPVHVFGTPYYAGWGLTHDYAAQPERRQRELSLEALFAVMFVQLSRHLDPVKQTAGSLEALLLAIKRHRDTTRRFADLRHVAGVGFQWWKRPFATPYLTVGGGTLRWIKQPDDRRDTETLAFWGARVNDHAPPDGNFVRIEDGFLHSAGLGSDMIAPHSQVIDRRGLYFDASRPSDLTDILNRTNFDASDLRRAAALRADIVRHGLTKYNLGRRAPVWAAPTNRIVALVPGQVADDASIRLGTRAVTTAEALLAEVRARCPDHFIVYKPHPDVLSGNRQGLVDAANLADVVDTEADLISLLDVADEVHTLSSLTGFEALLRGKPVYTYGLPFYAGWGLTRDALDQPWRERELSLDMLVAGALLHYPIYWDWRLKLFTTPEAVVAKLSVAASRPLAKVQPNRLRSALKGWRWSVNAVRYLYWQFCNMTA